MRLGIGSYTYGWAVGVRGHQPAQPLDELGLLVKAREAGVRILQIGDNLPLHTFTKERLDELARRAQRESIEIQIGARRLTVDQLEAYAEIAHRLGVKLVRFVIDDADYHPAPADVIQVLRKSARSLRELTLGIENHDRFPAQVLREIIEATGQENIGVCLDTANSLGAGEGLGTIVPILAPLTVNLHLKDFRVDRLDHLMGFTVTGTPAGKGLLDVPSLVAALEPFPRCDSAILEQWTPPEAELSKTIAREAAWASQSLAYLKPFFSNPI